jgi:hypothetical protein
MINQLIDVLLEDDCVCLAYVVYESPTTEEVAVRILSRTENRRYMFETELTVISTSAISGFYDSCDIAAAGYTQTGENEFVRTDGDDSSSDSDYESESEPDSESESLSNSDIGE